MKDFVLKKEKKAPKNQVLLFDAFGRHYKTIHVS
jgi:hypothetical protein